jgi:predicted MPP superfamily phosphohydrolase
MSESAAARGFWTVNLGRLRLRIPSWPALLMALLFWTGLVAGSVVLHRRAWLSPDPPLALVSLSGLLHVIEAPGWAAVRLFTHSWGRGQLLIPAIVAGVSWAFWLACLWMGLEVRRHALERLAATCSAPANPADASRRRFLVDAPLAAAVCLPAGSAVKSALIDPWNLQTRRYTIPLHGLPAALDGLRLVQLSDTHLGPRVPLEFLERAVRIARDLAPDAFILTGDYIMTGPKRIAAAAAIFKPLVATGRPVVGVLGNHDWYGNGRHMAAALRETGVRMIDNDRLFLLSRRGPLHADAGGAAGLCIAGVGDLLTSLVDFARALRGVPADMPRLVLSHNPDAAELPACTGDDAPRVDLMISGHTHGGQIMLPLIGAPMVPSRYGQKYLGGIVQGPRFPVLISRGIGMSLLPIRFGVPPEIVEITLAKA